MKAKLSPDEFWDLSWFELSLYQLRVEDEANIERDKEEGHWARFRIQWAQYHNAHSKKSVTPEDLIKLSFDKKEVDPKTKVMTPEDVEAKFGTKGKK